MTLKGHGRGVSGVIALPKPSPNLTLLQTQSNWHEPTFTITRYEVQYSLPMADYAAAVTMVALWFGISVAQVQGLATLTELTIPKMTDTLL